MLFIFFLIGAALSVGAWFIPELGLTSRAIICGGGVGVLFIVGFLSAVTRLYRKASANMAFVRTGLWGAKPIKDGGTVVLPVVHHVIPVSLETMRLNVERRGPHALITKDNLRVDLSAEFYIKVQANTDDIIQAARSLGGRNVQPDMVSELVQEKLVSALRTVAATKELVELHAKRDEFANAVQAICTHDLASNGLTLESVTISSLDQTDPTQLQERNVFDAQGLRKIAEITQKARVEPNEINREAEQAIATKNVSTRKQVLDLARDQAEFEAEQKMKVANVQAAREREIAEGEAGKQKVIPVQVTGEAEREANKKLVAARQSIQENKLREETGADVLAYMAIKEADAERQAAELKYQARLKLAEAEAQAAAR